MEELITKPQTTWQLARDLLDASRHAKRVARVVRLTTHLSMTEWLLLNRLAMSTQDRPGGLAKFLGVSIEMVSMTTPSLISRGYITKGTETMADLRGRYLRITDEGRAVLEALQKALVEADLVRPAQGGAS
jgi:DNA-binding MarR family transcriptional regulator